MIFRLALTGALASAFPVIPAAAHEPIPGTASAILNEGVMVEVGEAKVLFDPLYADGFGIYPAMDEALTRQIVQGETPYDAVDAVFISHAHADHFSAERVIRMLAAQGGLRLFAPTDALTMMRQAQGWDESFAQRIIALDLANAGPAAKLSFAGLTIEAMRVPHSGWPARHATVQNIVYRVSLPHGARVMHLGDADALAEHFAPHRETLLDARTQLAFLPYWMLIGEGADAFVDGVLNADRAVGIHLPIEVPAGLAGSGQDYFDELGETRPLPSPRHSSKGH